MILRALLNTVMGMGTVFVVLIFISFIISLFKYISVIQEKFSKKDAQPAPVPKAAPVPVAVEEEEEELVDDAELVAVITAAIMASCQTTNAVSADKLVVKSIRRARKRV
ncbi:MAG: OadG family protein [Lachnospiraceae bacterium]